MPEQPLDPELHRSIAAEVRKLGLLTMSSSRTGDAHRLALTGELDMASVGAIEDELRRVEATNVRAIVLDLSGLEFIDSSGMAALMAADARSRADSDRLTIIRPGGAQALRALELTGLLEFLPFQAQES